MFTGGCSTPSPSESIVSEDSYAGSTSVSRTEQRDQMNAEQEIAQVEYEEQATGEASLDENLIERKIIHEQVVVQQVQNLASVMEELEIALSSLQGAYMENLREWKREEREQTIHNAEMIIRIPIDDLSSFLSRVEGQGNILERQVYGEDVTEEFVDNQARLRNLKAHEERILQLFQQAENIEEMLKIEQELSRIRSSIEQIEGRQKFLAHVTSTAKLTLHLFQVEEAEYLSGQTDTSLLQEAGLGFQKSMKALVYFGERAFVFLISALPYLLVLFVVIFPVYLLTKKILPFVQQRWRK